jgi:hypothetical protein
MKSTHSAVTASRATEVTPATQTVYLEGELVLFRRDPEQHYPTKLSLPCIGPYSVISHEGNRVQARHLSTGVVRDMPVTSLKIFHGSLESAKAAADQDEDQYIVQSILAWRGDPLYRSTLEFQVLFADGDIIWLPYSTDLDKTVPYETFVTSLPCLYHLTFRTAADSDNFIKGKRSGPLPKYNIDEHLYVNLRNYGHSWYSNDLTELPDRFEKTYVVLYIVTQVFERYIHAACPALDEVWKYKSGKSCLDPYWCYAYGSTRIFSPDTMVLVDPQLLLSHPILISSDTAAQEALLAKHFPHHTVLPTRRPRR